MVCSLKTYEDYELLDMRKGNNYAHMKDSLDDCARWKRLAILPKAANEPSSQGLKIRGWSCFLCRSTVRMFARALSIGNKAIYREKQTKEKTRVYRKIEGYWISRLTCSMIMLELWGNKCVIYLGIYSFSSFHVLVFKTPVFLWTILTNSLMI